MKNLSWKKQFALLFLAFALCMSLALSAALYSADSSSSGAGKVYAAEGEVTVQSVSVNVVEGYTLKNGYYRADNGVYAFYQGMPQALVLERITGATVKYSDGTTQTVDKADVELTSGTGDNGRDNFEGEFSVKLSETESVSCKLNFIKNQEFALTYVGDPLVTSDLNLKSNDPISYIINRLSGKIYFLKTSGERGAEVLTGNLTTQDTLTPNSENLKTVLAGNTTYDKTVYIQYKEGDTINTNIEACPILITDIEYVKPNDIRSTGTASAQTALSEFNFSGLFFEFDYDGEYVYAPANDLKEYCNIEYRDKNDVKVEPQKLTKKVDIVYITWEMPDGEGGTIKGARKIRGIDVSQRPLEQPTIDNLTPTYKDGGCTVTLSGIFSDADNPVTVVVTDGSGHNITPVLEGNDYKITFDKGGTFYVIVTLDKELEGDYQWGTISGDNPFRENYRLRYTVKVSRAPMDVNLAYDVSADREYGYDEPSRKVSLAFSGSSEIFASDLQMGSVAETSGTSLPNYALRYYGWDSYTEENPSINAPTELGTYYVYAVTGANALYLAGKSEAIEFTISKRLISVDQINNTAEFANKEFTLSDIVKIDESASGKITAYDDTIADILTLSSTPETIFSARDYEVNLTLNSGKGDNYTFAGNKSSLSFTFTVTKAELTFNVWIGSSSFTYGDNVFGKLNPSFNSNGLKSLATVDTDNPRYFAKDGTEVFAENEPWSAGDYYVQYEAKPTENNNGVKDTDYSLDPVKVDFTINRKSVNGIYMNGNWNTDETSAGWIGQYGKEITSELINFDWQNNGSEGNEIVTVKVDGMRLDGVTLIDGEYCVLNQNSLLLTQAGKYTVTISLNKNYVWQYQNNNDDIVYYGKIYRAYLSDLQLSDTAMYNGSEQDVTVSFKVNNQSGKYADYLDATRSIITVSDVKGLTLAAENVSVSADSIDSLKGLFKVKAAGTYDVVIGITDVHNYEWYGSGITSEEKLTDKTQQYEVRQAPIQVIWKNTGDKQFDTSLAMQPTPDYDFDIFGTDSSEIKLTTTLYYNDDSIVAGNKITSSGTFVIRVTAISANTANSVVYMNYCVPLDENDLSTVKQTFTITPFGLDLITLINDTYGDAVIENNNKITVTYQGAAYFLSDFIENWSNYVSGETNYLSIKVGTSSDNNIGMKDADTYVIKVKPSDNYRWNGDKYPTVAPQQEYEFTLVINPLGVTLSWKNDFQTYGNIPTTVADVTNKCASDNVGVRIGYKKDGAIIADISKANAGEYVSYAAELTDNEKGNYVLDENVTNANLEHAYTVYKKGINKPSVNAVNSTFDASEHTVDVFNGNSVLSAVINAYRPKTWFTVQPTDDVAFADHGASINCETGTFTYRNAGKYAVTFTLDGTNYCWSDNVAQERDKWDNKSYSYGVDIASIERNSSALVAPKLMDYRAMEWKSGIADLKSLVFNGTNYVVKFGTVIVNGEGADKTVTYSTPPSDIQAGGVGEVASSARGEYYALLTLNDDVDKYNYVWIVDADDNKGVNFVERVSFDVYSQEDGSQIYLHYAITASQLPIFYEVLKGYVFGENGAYIGAEANLNRVTVDDILRMQVDESDKDVAGRGVPSFAFYDSNNNLVKDLVNGLPWEEGEYYVVVTLSFKGADADNYSTLTIRTDKEQNTLKLKVSPRDIQIEWSLSGGTVNGNVISTVYNGNAQVPVATITNMPSKNTLNDTEKPVLGINQEDEFLTNANSAITLVVLSIKHANGTDCTNFALGDYDARKAIYTIERASITVGGVDVDNHVYGDSLTVYDSNYKNYYNLTEGEIFERDGKVIRITIQDADGNKITDSLNALANGTYYIVPELENVNGNYTLTPGDKGVFTVVKRLIKVTINKDADGATKATSVYYTEPLDLISNSDVFTVTVTNGSGQSLQAPKDVFTLTHGVTKTSPVSGDAVNYPITCEIINANYAFAEDFAEEYYVVTSASIGGVSITPYAQPYDAAYHNVLDVKASTVDGTQLTWYYSIDGINWESQPYAVSESGTAFAGTAAKQIRNVSENATYYVKVTAANHSDIVYDSEGFTTNVTKRVLTVSVNMSIYYGEDGPIQLNYKQTVSDLRANGGIYTVKGFVGADNGREDEELFYSENAFYGITGGFGYEYIDAYVKGDSVGSYGLRVTVNSANGLTCGNYDFVGGEGALTVNALPITLINIKRYTAVYNQADPEQVVLTLDNVSSFITSSYGGSEVIAVYDAEIANIVSSVNHDALLHQDGITTNDAKVYEVSFTLNGNYTWSGNPVTTDYEITKASNVVVTLPGGEPYTLFADAVSGKDAVPVENAWIYGDYGDADGYRHLLGYDAYGRHRINSLLMLNHDRTLTISVAFGGKVILSTEVLTGQNATESLEALFGSIHNGKKFVAGEYTVTYRMDESSNYESFEEVWYFNVGRQDVTVTPDNLWVMYGENNASKTAVGTADVDLLSAYPYSVAGLVKNGGSLDSIDDVAAFVFRSVYESGFVNGSVKTGGYDILAYVNDTNDYNGDGKFVYETDNYVVTFEKSSLTVTPRPITIQIVDLENQFNLLVPDGKNADGTSKYKFQDAAQFKFKLLAGSFVSGDGNVTSNGEVLYDAQNVFVFNTDALTSPAGKNFKTNNKGEYPIYLTKGEHYGNDGANYELDVVNNTYSGSVPDEAVISKAGTFEIKPAQISTDLERLFTSETYDGTEKGYQLKTGLPDGLTLEFITSYYPIVNGIKGDKMDGVPVNVGTYRVEFTPDGDENYVASTSEHTYVVTKRTLTVSELNVESENTAVSDGKGYYFNGGKFTFPVQFSNLAGNEKIGLTWNVSRTKLSQQLDDSLLTAFMTCDMGFSPKTDNQFIYTVRNSGVYTVTVELANGSDGFIASNYQFDDSGAVLKTFKQTIALKTLTIGTQNATVQYGAPLSDTNRFSGFAARFFVDNVEATDAYNQTTKLLLKSEQEKGYLKLKDGLDGVKYTSTYNVSTSVWGTTYELSIDPQCIVAYNFVIAKGVTDVLSIVPREIDVTVKGFNDMSAADRVIASCVYTGQGTGKDHNPCLSNSLSNNRTKFLSVDYGANWNKPNGASDPLLSVLLKISSAARNVGDQPVYPSQSADKAYEMYKIGFKNAQGERITDNSTDEENVDKLPVYKITPAKLQLFMGKNGVAFNPENVGTFSAFGVPYGTNVTFNNSSASTLILRYKGWVNGEGDEYGNKSASGNGVAITEFTALRADNAYKAWISNAFEKYTVRPVLDYGGTSLKYDNYEIEIVDATMTVEQLVITGKSHEVTFTPVGADGVYDYNNGIDGIEHNVNLTYTYGSNVALPVGSASDPLTGASVKYDTTASDAKQAGRAPTKVHAADGAYVATVTLASQGNYKFANGTYVEQFTHKVAKRGISLSWSYDNLELSETVMSAVNTVNGYVESLMIIQSFNYGTTDIRDSGNYTTTDQGLTFTATSLGRYELGVEFNVAAARNYLWQDENIKRKVIQFTLSSSDNRTTLTVTVRDDMTYNNFVEPVSTLKDVFNNVISDPVITYTYAYLTDNLLELGRPSFDEVTGLGLHFSSSFPQNAGRYVVKAFYAGDGIYNPSTDYYVFQIYKESVSAPTISVNSLTYKGTELTADLDFDTKRVYIDGFAYDHVTTSFGATVKVFNADTYRITLALFDTQNYVWSSSIQNEENRVEIVKNDDGEIISVTLILTVAQANDNEIIWNDDNEYSVSYGQTYSIVARATYSDSVQYAYAVKGSYTEETAGQITAWSSQRPSNADTYLVRVVCGGNGNYNAVTRYKTLTINKAVLEVVPQGTLQYEQTFNQAKFSFSVKGDVLSSIDVDENLVKYSLVNGSLDKDNLTCDEYALTMDVDEVSGFVKGLSNGNYDFVLSQESGYLVVTPKPIRVQIGNLSMVYGERIDMEEFLNTVQYYPRGEWDSSKDVDILGIVPSTNALSNSDVGTYVISAKDYTNKNYDVTFIDGVFSVTVLNVRVEIAAGGGEYGSEIVGAKVTHIFTVNLLNNRDLGADALEFNFRYTGSPNGSSESVNTEKCPTLAGTYIASVSGIKASDKYKTANYSLDLSAGNVSVPFVITQKVVDASKLVIESKAFTDNPQRPTVSVPDEYSDMFYDKDGQLVFKQDGQTFTSVGPHTFVLTLLDANNYKWLSVDVADKEATFTITKAKNELVSGSAGERPSITINGWTYGAFNPDINIPEAFVKFGSADDILFMYATERDGEYTTKIPSDGNAGTYWVRVTVLGTDNYERFDSEPVSFTIEKVVLTAPSLVLDSSNSVYTGKELRSSVIGFNSLLMDYSYSENSTRNGSELTVTALRAGKYEVKIILTQSNNYRWADDTAFDGEGNAVLTWNVAKQKVAMPTDSDKKLIANGQLLTYLPQGFDSSIMGIKDNQSGYGGSFTALVWLLDTDNYEWENGQLGELAYDWQIVGANTVFIAVTCSISGAAVILLAVALVQYLRYRKKKYAELQEEFGEDTFSPQKKSKKGKNVDTPVEQTAENKEENQ